MVDARQERSTAEPGDTATQLLDCAERLFAERGLDRVSLREIVRASGQGNLSAAHYHFGSREALIGRLLTRRVRAINVIRHQRLDALVASGADRSAYQVAYVSVMVLCDIVRTMPWGPDYVRVAAHALFGNFDVWSYLDPESASGHYRAREMLRALLPELPQSVFKDRIWCLNNLVTHAIARWVQSYGPVTVANRRRYDAMCHNLAAFLAAGMAAPMDAQSDATLDERMQPA